VELRTFSAKGRRSACWGPCDPKWIPLSKLLGWKAQHVGKLSNSAVQQL
jgi:hypothetical protein